MFLLAALLFVLAVGMTAQAGITVKGDADVKTITIDGEWYDLDKIWANGSTPMSLELWNQTGGVWELNFSIIVEGDAILQLAPNATDPLIGCTWLKMNTTYPAGAINPSNITVEGKLFVNDTKITGWNWSTDTNNTDWENPRPYIYINCNSEAVDWGEAYFLNSTIGFLGYDRDNMYGITYEDGLNTAPVGCWMHNCTVMENFQGITFQGRSHMNVTNSHFNNTKESGITYTTGGNTGAGSHWGYVGDSLNASLDLTPSRDGVIVLDCYGDATAMGIRLHNSDNITFDDVTINNASTDGLWVEYSINLTANDLTVHHCADNTDDGGVMLKNSSYCTFTDSTVHTPDGADGDGFNWLLYGEGNSNSSHNSFIRCHGYGAATPGSADFRIEYSGSQYNTFTDCTANNSYSGFDTRGTSNTFTNCAAHHHDFAGFFGYDDDNTTFTDCRSHNSTYYDFKLWGSHYDTVTNGFANDSYIGVYILDINAANVAQGNSVTGLTVNRESSYGVSIGTDGGVDNVCHNNTVTTVTVTGTTTGDGIYLFDNVTRNNISGCTVTGLTTVTSVGFGMANWANNNTFYNCGASSNGGFGYYFDENTTYNTVTLCSARGDLYGMRVTEFANNNTVNYSDFNNNTWMGIWISANANSNGGNNFWYSTSHDNGYGMYVEDTPEVQFTEVDAYNNSLGGVGVIDGASAYFFYCTVSNPTLADPLYDWYVSDDSTADIYSPYILGFNRSINNQSDTVQPYGKSHHASGDGIWELNTTQMLAYPEGDSDYAWINITYWDTSTGTIEWVVNGSTGVCYHMIGGLTPGERYDIIIDTAVQSTNTSFSGQVIPNHGTTGCLWFNYTGTWSPHTIRIRPHVVPEDEDEDGAQPQNGDGGEVPPDSDGDGYSDSVELALGTNPYDPYDYPGAPARFLGMEWYWWAIIVAVILAVVLPLMYIMLIDRKLRKKLFGF